MSFLTPTGELIEDVRKCGLPRIYLSCDCCRESRPYVVGNPSMPSGWRRFGKDVHLCPACAANDAVKLIEERGGYTMSVKWEGMNLDGEGGDSEL